MSDTGAPAVPDDVAAMLTAGGVPMIDAASAAGVSVPPGIMPLARPAQAFAEPDPAPEPAVPVQPAPAAAVGAPLAPAADLTPASDPVAPVEAPAAPSTSAPAAVEVPAFIGDRSRSRVVVLEWPLSFRGRIFDRVVVTRPTVRQVAEYYDRLLALSDEAGAKGIRFPIFLDTAGAPVPDEVMDALDPDDADLLQEDISDFLPRRLRALRSAPASIPDGGEAIGQTSAEPLAGA